MKLSYLDPGRFKWDFKNRLTPLSVARRRRLVLSLKVEDSNLIGLPAKCQCCKMSMMQNDNDANCQLFKYVNVAKCQWLLNVNTKLNE
jgi:hypothetical protein